MMALRRTVYLILKREMVVTPAQHHQTKQTRTTRGALDGLSLSDYRGKMRIIPRSFPAPSPAGEHSVARLADL